MSRRQQRDRIERALETLPWYERSGLGMEGGGRTARRTLAGLVRQALAPELARGAEAEDTVARVRAALRGLPVDGTVAVRRVLDALHGEEPAPVTSRPTAETLAEIADLENRLREAQTALLDIQPCTCTDQVRSVVGTCPERGHREYSSCPKRKAAATATAPNPKED